MNERMELCEICGEEEVSDPPKMLMNKNTGRVIFTGLVVRVSL